MYCSTHLPCHLYTPTVSPNSSAFHTPPPPTTSLSQASLPPHHSTTTATGYLSQSSLLLFWCSNVSRTAWSWRWRSTWYNTPEDFSLWQHSCQNLTCHEAQLRVTNKVHVALWVTAGNNKWQNLSPVVGCWSEFQFPSLHPHHFNWFVSVHITLQRCRVSFLDCDNSRWDWEVWRCCETQQYLLLRTYDIRNTAENKILYLQRTIWQYV